MKKIVALVLAALMLVFLVSCGDGSKDADETSGYEGTYKCTYANLLDYPLEGEDAPDITLEIKSGGKCVWTSEDDVSEFDYSVEGTTMTFTSSGLDVATAKLEGSKIVIDDWYGLGFAYTFEKQ